MLSKLHAKLGYQFYYPRKYEVFTLTQTCELSTELTVYKIVTHFSPS